MSTPNQDRQKVFISYSHQDAEWLTRLRVHLRPLERDYDIEVWDDTKIIPGSHWREEIKRAVESAKVAVLLVSADFLASKFIVEDELPPLLKAAANEGATILSVILSPSRFTNTESLSRFQSVNHPSAPIINMARGEQEEMFVRVSEEIERYIKSSSIIKATRLPAGSTETSIISPAEITIKRIQTSRDDDLPPTAVEPAQPKKVLEPNKASQSSAIPDVAIDLAISFDSYQISVYRKGHGIVISEPSIIAINALTNTVEAFGKDVEKYFHGVSNIAIYNPINDGKVSDRVLAEKILRYFIDKASGSDNIQIRSRVVIAIPPSLTQAERRALVDTVYNAKVSEVYLVDRILCAAVGAGETTRKPHGNMTVYVGKSSIEIIAISQDGRASSQPEGVAAGDMKNDITQYIKRKYNLLIGDNIAEEIKLKLGSAFPLNDPLTMEVRGLNSIEGIPKTITITDDEVREALADAVSEIVHAVRVALERTPRQVAADIIGGGIILTGAEGNLNRLDKRLAIETGLPVSMANDPQSCVVLGAGKMLSDFKLPVEKRLSRTFEWKVINLVDRIITPIARLFSSDLAIDFSTNNTLIYAKGRGIVTAEPSILAINKLTKLPIAVGKAAKEMFGRAPNNVALVRPLKNGIIINSAASRAVLRRFIRKSHNGKSWVRPRVVLTIPSGLTKIESQDFADVAYGAKASEVYLVEKLVAAAIGAGLPITEPHGNMIVDIGGGTTDIAVISLSGIIYSRTIRVGGNEMDKAVISFIKRKYNLLIGERTAELIKINIGSAFPLDEQLSIDIRGRNLTEGIPKTITITDDEVREALADSINTLVNAVRVALERTPPELSADIVERGIVLTGGGALLKNLDRRLSIETGLPVSVAEDPRSCIVLGAGKMLSDFNLLKRVKWDNEPY